VLALVGSTLLCRLWLGPLFACCHVTAVLVLGPLCHCSIPGLSSVHSAPSFSGFSFNLVLVLSLTPVSCTAGNLHFGCGHFLPQSTISLGQDFSKDVYLTPCNYCTAGHLPAGGSQLLPGSLGSVSSALHVALQLAFGPLRCFLSPLTGITAASSLGTSCCATSGFISSEAGSSFPLEVPPSFLGRPSC
jgi:hypothetical protein